MIVLLDDFVQIGWRLSGEDGQRLLRRNLVTHPGEQIMVGA